MPTTQEAQKQREEILRSAGKLEMADHARLMGDNQRDLDMVHQDDQRARDLQARIAEAKAPEGTTQPAPANPTGGDGMNVLIDSPTTTHNYPAPKASGLKKAAVAAALLCAGGLVAALGYQQFKPQPTAPPADASYDVLFFDQAGNPIEIPHISEKPPTTEP